VVPNDVLTCARNLISPQIATSNAEVKAVAEPISLTS
jgi:hypothetical protein